MVVAVVVWRGVGTWSREHALLLREMLGFWVVIVISGCSAPTTTLRIFSQRVGETAR